MNTQTISLQYNIKIAKKQIFRVSMGDGKESREICCGDTSVIPI